MTTARRARWRLLLVPVVLGASATLSACLPQTAGAGFGVDVDSATCTVVDTTPAAILRIPLNPTAFDRISLYGVSLLERSNLRIAGVLTLANDSVSESPEPATLADSLREAGTEIRRPQPTRRGETTELALLITRDDASATDSSAHGIRIEWSAGEPVYYQDVLFDIDLGSRCDLGDG